MKKSYTFIVLISLFTLLVTACNLKDKRDSPTTLSKTIQKDTLTLLFVGDLMQHTAQIEAAKSEAGYNYQECFQYVTSLFKKADFTIANLEVTLAGEPYRGYPSFSAPKEFAESAIKAGINVLLTANNHCLDRGKKGLERTLATLDTLQVKHLGVYRTELERQERYPLLLEKNNIRVALLNYTYGTNGLTVKSPNHVNYIDTFIIKRDLAEARALAPDLIIACLHWGEEYQVTQSKKQEELAGWLIDNGVTDVIGSHPHVIQPMVVLEDTLTSQKHLITYSLGNFISNMSAKHTDIGAIAKIQISKAANKIEKKYSYTLTWCGRPKHTKQNNYLIIPTGLEDVHLSASAQLKRNQALKDSRRITTNFDQKNISFFEIKKD